jgi:hypothetical protein
MKAISVGLLGLLGRLVAGDDTYLANWMGEISAALQSSSILDMSLPGTHDSLTYDLSTVISDGGIDGYDALSVVLHDLSSLPVAEKVDALRFARAQAQTQGLNVTEQLDNGVRFLDFRVMFEAQLGDWYSLHMVQSNQPAMTYLQQVRAWLDAHPTELVVVWLSKHGSECATGNDAYPGVPVAAKQAFWAQVEALFQGVLFDAQVSSVNATAYPDLLARGHRIVFWVSDFLEFTGQAPEASPALDGCRLDNRFSSNVADYDLDGDVAILAAADATAAQDKASVLPFWAGPPRAPCFPLTTPRPSPSNRPGFGLGRLFRRRASSTSCPWPTPRPATASASRPKSLCTRKRTAGNASSKTARRSTASPT